MFGIFFLLLTLIIQSCILSFELSGNDDLSPGYDEDTARRFFDLAAASQVLPRDESKRQRCFDKSWSGYNYETTFFKSVPCDDKGNECQVYVAHSSKKDSYVISFRGTNDVSELVVEGLSSINKYDTFYYHGAAAGQGSVNHYFNEAVKTLWPDIGYATYQRSGDTAFYITGHSFGGALASIAASRVYLEGYRKIYLYTFGQPRVWDYATAQVFNDWVPHAWRVVHYSDPIPHGPSLNGKEQGKPYHHAQEIWYNDNFTTYSQCSKDDGEDLNCSDKLNNFKFVTDVVNKDHLHYFGVQVIDYGAAGCTTNIVHAYKLFSSLTFVLLQLFVFA